MPNSLDYKGFLRELSIDQFQRFVSVFGGGAKKPEEIITWVNSPEREKLVCDKIRQVFEIEILTANERQEQIAKVSADATKRQANAAEKANGITRDTPLFFENMRGVSLFILTETVPCQKVM